jgi:hypothetical protein
MPALHFSQLDTFVSLSPAQILGELVAGLASEGFDTNKLTTSSWQQEIEDLQKALLQLTEILPAARQWRMLMEYVIPIIGKRLDCVVLASDLIYVIEYKGGRSTSASAALRQAQDYALNLADFHEESRNRVVVPLALGCFQCTIHLDVTEAPHVGGAMSARELAPTLHRSFQAWASQTNPINPVSWNSSRYFPVPTIIEAASVIYQNHDVKNIAYSRSGIENLNATQDAVAAVVRDARERNAKILVVITGVPGAGKTLAGLNAVQILQPELDLKQEQASFLSGNGPLVKVLQVALKRSIGKRKRGVTCAVQSRIRDVHRFVRDSYGETRPPADRLIVFDEAQRAWTASKNQKKFGRNISEPDMILEIMGRHEGWAVVVALVGGGQEIHAGEAGLAAWGDAVLQNRAWEIVASPEALRGGVSVAGSSLFGLAEAVPPGIAEEKSFHLAVARRSFTTEVTAAWVNDLLAGRREEAAGRAADSDLPIYLTRDLRAARRWLTDNAKGARRAGLIASSGASRLRAEGVETPTFTFLGGIDYSKWFLEPAGDHRSSNQLEVALSEFELQGLEIDLAGLLWGGDLIFEDTQVITRRLNGRKWAIVEGLSDPQASADDPRIRILNKYRVLLTRFRKGMVIYVPEGSESDSTRRKADFNGVFHYLQRCGLTSLPEPYA